MRGLLVLLLVLLFPAAAAAQSASATARVSQEVVEAGSTFQYQADASVRGAEDIGVAKAPGFGSLQVVGQQKMPQIITINGVTERRLSLRYAVVASEEGRVQIQPPTFRIGDDTVSANAVTITVVKKGSAPTPKAPKRDSRYFIDASIEPTDRPPYVGEQLTLRYDLYVDGAQLDVQPSYSREPSLDDFWIQELTDRVARNDQMVSVNGRLYKRTSMWSYALFPLHAGPVDIEPAEVELVVGGFFRRGQSAKLQSEPVHLDVQPLPPDAPPGFYEGNVGNWSFKIGTDQSQTKVGRAIVVELTVTGEGQVSRVKLPELPPIEGTRVSDVDESSTPEIRGLTVGGKRTAKYTITPQKQGQITVPSLEFSWFDPAKGKYRKTRTDPIVVKVAPGELGPQPVEPEKMAKRNVAADEDLIANLIADLQPLRDPPDVDAAPDPARFPWIYWLLIGASVVVFIATALGHRLRSFAQRAAPERDQRARARAAVDRLDDAGADAHELARAIREGLHEAWGVPKGSVTAADVQAALTKRGLDAGAGRELSEVLRDCEDVRFAPQGQNLDKKVVERARRAMQKLAAAVVILLALAAPARAETDWAQMAKANPDSVDVQYDLGTVAAQNGDYGTARLALERATYLSPWDSGVEDNRSLVERIVRLNTIERSRTGRTMEGDETLFWWRTAAHINPHLIGIAATLLWLLAALAIRVRRRSDVPAVRDAAVVGLVVAVLLALTASFGAVARTHILRTAKPVVVMSEKLELREGPNVAAKLKRTPPAMVPGTLLRVVDERDDWVKVSWHSDAGWTRKGIVKRVNE